MRILGKLHATGIPAVVGGDPGGPGDPGPGPGPAAPFRVGVWLQDASNAAAWKALGIDTYVGQWNSTLSNPYNGATPAQMAALVSADMKLVVSHTAGTQSDANASIVVGWDLNRAQPDTSQGGLGGPAVPTATLVSEANAIRTASGGTTPIGLVLSAGPARPGWIGMGSTAAASGAYFQALGDSGAFDFVIFSAFPFGNATAGYTEPDGYPTVFGDPRIVPADVVAGVTRLRSWFPDKPVYPVLACSPATGTYTPTRAETLDLVRDCLDAGAAGIVWFAHWLTGGYRTDAFPLQPGNAAAETVVADVTSYVRSRFGSGTVNQDATPPTVASTFPASGATAHPISAGPAVTFSEPMSAASISTSSVVVTPTTPGAIAYDSTSRTVSFAPTVALLGSTTYTVTVRGGPTGVRDSAGNAMTSDFVYSFTTAAAPTGGGGGGGAIRFGCQVPEDQLQVVNIPASNWIIQLPAQDHVIENMHFRGHVYFNAFGTPRTIRATNCIFEGGWSGSWGILSADGPATLIARNCTFRWRPGVTPTQTASDIDALGSGCVQNFIVDMDSCDISGIGDGIKPAGGSVIRRTYIHDLWDSGTGIAASDCLQMSEGSVLVDTCKFICHSSQSDANSAVFTSKWGNTNQYLEVRRSYLDGGAWSVYSNMGTIRVMDGSIVGPNHVYGFTNAEVWYGPSQVVIDPDTVVGGTEAQWDALYMAGGGTPPSGGGGTPPSGGGGTPPSGGGGGTPPSGGGSSPPPTITSRTPAVGATGVATSATISMTFSQDMDPLSLTTSTVTTTPSIVTTRLYDPPPPSTTSLTGYGCQVPEGQLQVIDAPPSGVIFLPSGSRTYRNTYFRGAVYWMDTGTGTLTFEDCIIEGGYGSWGMFTGGNGTGVVNMTRTTLRWRANGPERIYDQARGGGVVHTFGYEVHLDWCDISGWGDGVKVGTGASTIENCYIHDLMLVPYEISGNNFNDCISFSGGSGHVARNNILLSRPESYAGNSCIFFAYGFGGSALIESNYINGGVWTLFRDDGQSPGAQVTARNNQFGPDNHFAPYIGTYVEFSGNTFDVPIPQISGGQAPAPAPQPSTRAYTLTPVSGLPNSTTYTVTVRGGPTGVRNLQGTPLVADSSWTFTTAAAAPPPSPPPSGGGGASAAPLTVAAVGAGAEANMASVPIIPPTAPTGSGRLVNVSSSSALQTALNGAIPGDCIVLANGAYGGNFVVPADRQGTAANPIVIRAANRRLPSFPGGDGRAVFEVLGRYVYFSGLHLNGPDRTSFNMGGNNNVIHDCLFTNAGGWSSGNAGGDGQAGVIYTFGARAGTHNYGPDFEHWQAAMNSPLVNRFHTICANEFVGPRATVLWQGAGSVGNTFSHNIIRGPKNYTTTGDGMCIKVATGFGHEPCQLSIRFNSFLGWDSNAYYYLIGIKANNVTIEGNYIIDGTISIRSGDDCVIRNNAIETNGGIVLQGRRHVVEGNWCRSAEGDGGPAFFGDGFQKGPLVMFVRMLNGNFNGTTYPYWLEEVRDSTIRNNTFVRSVHRNDGVASFCNAGWQAIFEPGALIRNNQFLGNRFVAMVSPDRMIGGRNVDGGVVTQIMGVNTWQNNRFIFAGGAGSVVVPGGILGSNGNVAAVS